MRKNTDNIGERRRRLPLFACLAFAVASFTAHAGYAASTPKLYTEPLGIALEAWPYPYRVHFLPLVISGRAVRMGIYGRLFDGDLDRSRTANDGRNVPRLHETLFPVLPAERYEPFVAWRMRVALGGEFERFAYAAAATYEMIYRQPVRYECRLLAPPVLSIVGAVDRTVVMRQYGDPDKVATKGDFPALAKTACDETARCELTVVPRVGHVPHLETPDIFNERVLNFLRSTP